MSLPSYSILTHSLGACEQHSLPAKLKAAAAAGFEGVEIFIPDFEHHATHHTNGDKLAAAKEIGGLCAALKLHVVCLQPLRDIVELAGTAGELDAAVASAVSWFPVMDALATDLILCCSSSLPSDQLLSDPGECAGQLGRFTDEARKAGKRVAFEALSWGTNVWRTMQAWEIVQKADRPNLGIVLDSFNALGREWAEPTSETGTLPVPSERLTALLFAVATIPADKVFLLQVADARFLDDPLPSTPKIEGEPRPPRMVWSRTSRLFPLEDEKGAYLPIVEFTRTVVEKCGYKGPLSLEIFNDDLREEGEEVPAQHARRGMKSLHALMEQVQPL